MIDKTDLAIIQLLRQNARMQLSELGDQVHLTGQAVSNRIKKLEAGGVIKGYSVMLDETKLGKSLVAYITVFMKNTNHPGFQDFLMTNELVVEANRISGEGCYLLKVIAATQAELTLLLDSILNYGNYRINLSLEVIK